MQMLCQSTSQQVSFSKSIHWVLQRLLVCAALIGACNVFAQDGNPQNKLMNQVAQWLKVSQQLAANQFSIVPLDARVQIQGCDRPLTMDLPFASRETIRVRCLSQAPWQLYMRVVLESGAPSVSYAKSADGTAMTARRVVVGKQLLRNGTMVTADMLQEVAHSGQGLDAQVVSTIKDVENAEMVRDVPAGSPLHSHDVRRALLVKQGQSVLLTVSQGSGFSITARVEALQDGKIGDQVRMKNPESGRLMTGVVTGPNAARGL
jgi:flagella basal body P-ring formation protein FlgA